MVGKRWDLVWRLVPRNVKRSVAADSAQENGGRPAQCVRAITREARFQYTHKPASYRIFVLGVPVRRSALNVTPLT